MAATTTSAKRDTGGNVKILRLGGAAPLHGAWPVPLGVEHLELNGCIGFDTPPWPLWLVRTSPALSALKCLRVLIMHGCHVTALRERMPRSLVQVSLIGCDALTAIGVSVFSHCDLLESIHLPATLVTIGARAFAGCSALKSIELPTSLQAIGENAFGYCAALTSIDLSMRTSL